MSQKISRKTFLAGGLAGSAALMSSRWLQIVSGADAAAVKITEVAPGILVHRGQHAVFTPENAGDICNLTVIVGKDALAVIDTGGSAQIGREFLSAIRTVSDKPIRYVINTHMHPDHVFGNAPFKAETPTFVAHHKMARGLAARAERYLSINKELLGNAAFEGTEIVYPTEHIKDVTELDLGDRKLVLTPRPTAHTDNDLTVFDPTTKTLVAGDLLFSEHIPTLDGSIVGWIAVIESLRKESADRVVPGHGPASMSWPAALDPLDRYLRGIAQAVRNMIKEGKSLSEALSQIGPPDASEWLLASDFHARTVTAAFAELEWE